jgi:hypothetical protein
MMVGDGGARMWDSSRPPTSRKRREKWGTRGVSLAGASPLGMGTRATRLLFDKAEGFPFSILIVGAVWFAKNPMDRSIVPKFHGVDFSPEISDGVEGNREVDQAHGVKRFERYPALQLRRGVPMRGFVLGASATLRTEFGGNYGPRHGADFFPFAAGIAVVQFPAEGLHRRRIERWIQSHKHCAPMNTAIPRFREHSCGNNSPPGLAVRYTTSGLVLSARFQYSASDVAHMEETSLISTSGSLSGLPISRTARKASGALYQPGNGSLDPRIRSNPSARTGCDGETPESCRKNRPGACR